MDRNEFLEPFERMLSSLFPLTRIREIDKGAGWQAELAEIEESGFLELLASEADGGAGLGFDVAIPLFMALGRKLAPLEIGSAMIARARRVPVDDENANAVLCAAAIAGAGNHLLAVTTAYANERVQFGKPIGRQQALQQQLAVMAEDCVSIRLAVELAGRGGQWPDGLRASLAKSVASEAAPRIANIAHAVHGAIGISAEHDLQLYTRRLHRWRVECGSETLHNRAIGRAVLSAEATSVDWLRAEIFGEV